MDNNELMHYGVKGMKWGVIRTPEQLGHTARKVRDKIKSAYQNSKNREPSERTKNKQKVANLKKERKRVRLMTDAEIRERISRIESEKKLKSLIDSELSPGRNAVQAILSESGSRAAKTIVSGAMLYAVKVAMTKEFDARDAAGYLAPKPKNK